MFTHNSGCECSHMAEGQEGIVGVWVTVRTLSLEYSGFLIVLCDQRVKHSSRSSCAAAVKIGRRGKV